MELIVNAKIIDQPQFNVKAVPIKLYVYHTRIIERDQRSVIFYQTFDLARVLLSKGNYNE